MFFYIDKTGRRTLLIYGAVAMGICHYIVGGLLSAGTDVPGGVGGNPNIPIELQGAKANAVIAFCYLLIIIYAMTLAPVAWVYAAEVWSLETRATGMGISAIGNWLVRLTVFEFSLNDQIADFCSLTVQLRARPLHPAWLHQHQVRHVHHLWHHVHACRRPVLLHISRDRWQVAGRDRGHVRARRSQAVAHSSWKFEARCARCGGSGKALDNLGPRGSCCEGVIARIDKRTEVLIGREGVIASVHSVDSEGPFRV